MTTQEALLAAILADPDDDLPRLAYADWCEEMGNQARADMIRAQLADPNDNLTVPFDDAIFHWKRGFIEEVHCLLDWWQKHGPAYVHKYPLRRVLITDCQPAAYLITSQRRFVWEWSHTGGSIQHAKQALPFEIWHYLPRTNGLASFDNKSEAMEALSQACLTWAKAQSPQEPSA